MAGLPYHHHHHMLLPTPFLGPPQVSTPHVLNKKSGNYPTWGEVSI